jgi:hypothetical protein
MTWLDLTAIDSKYYCSPLSASLAADNALYFATTCMDIVDSSTILFYDCQYNS